MVMCIKNIWLLQAGALQNDLMVIRGLGTWKFDSAKGWEQHSSSSFSQKYSFRFGGHYGQQEKKTPGVFGCPACWNFLQPYGVTSSPWGTQMIFLKLFEEADKHYVHILWIITPPKKKTNPQHTGSLIAFDCYSPHQGKPGLYLIQISSQKSPACDSSHCDL